MVEESVKTSTEMTQPVIIDLGKQKNRTVKNLKKGKGKLWGEVLDAVEEVKDMLGAEADGKVLVPIVMIYREKPRRKRRALERMLSPFLSGD
jgi:Family of unknown function (DUF6200)